MGWRYRAEILKKNLKKEKVRGGVKTGKLKRIKTRPQLWETSREELRKRSKRFFEI